MGFHYRQTGISYPTLTSILAPKATSNLHSVFSLISWKVGADDIGAAGTLIWRPGRDIIDMNRATEAIRFPAGLFSSRSDSVVRLHYSQLAPFSTSERRNRCIKFSVSSQAQWIKAASGLGTYRYRDPDFFPS